MTAASRSVAMTSFSSQWNVIMTSGGVPVAITQSVKLPGSCPENILNNLVKVNTPTVLRHEMYLCIHSNQDKKLTASIDNMGIKGVKFDILSMLLAPDPMFVSM